ncbi:MAG: hypothetical protein QHI38_08480 [Armatimonadota bacterium]|nr:hypothetical protein [Armatimonadota bacterium]
MRQLFRHVFILVAILAAAASASLADDNLAELSAEGFTVRYPPAFETQAKTILKMAAQHFRPGIEVHRQIVQLLSNPSELAAYITDLLGAEETQEATRIRLTAYKQKSEALVHAFSNIRIIPAADAVVTGGVDAGVIQVRYSHDSDEFSIGLQLENVDEEVLKRSFFPVFVNADGRIRSEKNLPETALNLLGSSKAMIPAVIHETVSWIISEKLNLYHPFTRWFLEGVTGWVTVRVLNRAGGEYQKIAAEVYTPGAAAKKVRDKVNLLAWPQSAFQNKRPPYIDPELEVAQTQYAVEAVTKLLGGNRNRTLARIIGELKHRPDVDTEAICAAINKITGIDFKKTLLTYVPEDIVRAMNTGEARKLISQAEKLAQERKWVEAIAKLRRALQIDPYDINARLNLAWLERENSENLDSEIQIFTAARLFKEKTYSFRLFAPSVEGNYVLARLAILLGNLDYAKKFLEPVLAANPNHKDAKRALEEIRRIEASARGER